MVSDIFLVVARKAAVLFSLNTWYASKFESGTFVMGT